MPVIKCIDKKSVLAGKIRSGDCLTAVNGHRINDILDYMYFSSESSLRLDIIRDGRPIAVCAENPDYLPLGLSFDEELMDGQKRCRNNCVFCFIDQNPKGMRETLYFKDDDHRMSFLHGNYITLTNLSDGDIERIISYKISPLNISVHSTDDETRKKLLGNKNAGGIIEKLRRFAEGGIALRCQVVLVKGINDGEKLKETMEDLAELYPAVSSVSVVPAGLTRHRQGLYPLEEHSPGECAEVIEIIQSAGDRNLERFGARLIYPADEFYIKAGLELPQTGFYEDFEQLENGVGMSRLFLSEIKEGLELLGGKKARHRISVATGAAAFGLIGRALQDASDYIKNLDCRLYKINNDFYGNSVSVAGLITGQDLINQLEGRDLGECLLITESMLRHERDMFLDSLTLDEVSGRLGVKIRPVPNDGRAFVQALIDYKKLRIGNDC